MKRSALFAGLLVMVANQVAALSCMRPDVARSFNWAAESDENYAVLMGTFRYEDVTPPRGGSLLNPQGYQVRAQFSGFGLGADGFGEVQPLSVTIDVQCSASWCGSPPPMDETALAFVESTTTGYVLRADACGSNVFAPVAIADIARVEDCMKGLGCEEQRR